MHDRDAVHPFSAPMFLRPLRFIATAVLFGSVNNYHSESRVGLAQAHMKMRP